MKHRARQEGTTALDLQQPSAPCAQGLTLFVDCGRLMGDPLLPFESTPTTTARQRWLSVADGARTSEERHRADVHLGGRWWPECQPFDAQLIAVTRQHGLAPRTSAHAQRDGLKSTQLRHSAAPEADVRRTTQWPLSISMSEGERNLVCFWGCPNERQQPRRIHAPSQVWAIGSSTRKAAYARIGPTNRSARLDVGQSEMAAVGRRSDQDPGTRRDERNRCR